ncbi:MAG: thiamine phosphate synthase [Alphaproteobacteria bacterium]
MKKNRAFDLSVYFIADPQVCAGRDLLSVVTSAAEGGVTMVQLRNKIDAREVVLKQARALYAILKPLNIPLIINDHVEIGAGFDGVHLGQGDASPEAARKILGPDKIIGVTAFEENHFEAINPDIVDYAGTGPFYETLTKPGKPVLGAENFKKLIRLSRVPVVGIGGITPDNAAEIIKAGASGVAMMRGISESADPFQAARAFVNTVQNARLKVAS